MNTIQRGDPVAHDSDRPIFVIGCARSGTTMLQLMINSHPRLAMPPETRFLLHLYNDRALFGDLRDPANVERVADFIIKRRRSRFRDLELDGAEVRALLHEAPATMGSMIGTVFGAYAAANGKARWGDKRPWYIHRVDRLLALFPDAQIIHIVRDGRDTVSSLINMDWYDRGFKAALLRWIEAMEIGDHLGHTLAAEQYHEFRYEDLVADPESELTELCQFLGEDFNESMLSYYSISKTPEWKTWHPNTRLPVNDSAMQRWRTDLTGFQLRIIESAGREQLLAHGYTLSLPRWRRVMPLQTRGPWRKYLAYRAAGDAEDAQLEREVQAEYKYPVASVLTDHQRALADDAGWLQSVQPAS